MTTPKPIDHDLNGRPIYDPLNECIRRAPSPIPGINAAASDTDECRSAYCECEPGKCSAGRADKREQAAAEIVAAEAAKGVHSAFNACMYRDQCRANAGAAPAPRIRLTKVMLGKAWRESGALAASPPEWAIQFAQNIASAILQPQVDDRAACARMANDMRAEQTFLGSCRETCSQYDKARWDRLQRVIDYLDIAASTEPNAEPEHSAIYISKRLTGSDKDAAFVQAHINQAVSEAVEALASPSASALARDAASVLTVEQIIAIARKCVPAWAIDWPTSCVAFARALLSASSAATVSDAASVAPDAEGHQLLLDVLGYPWLPCPICKGVEGCDHAVPERARAAISSQTAAPAATAAEADQIVANWIKSRGTSMNGEAYGAAVELVTYALSTSQAATAAVAQDERAALSPKEFEAALWELVEQARTWEKAYSDPAELYSALDTYKSAVEQQIRYIINSPVARAASSATAPLTSESEARYIVIGYGESDYPQAAFVHERDGLLDAVLGMMFVHPADADDEIREDYRKDLTDSDEWSEGIWRTEFEIGGIVVYDLGYGTAQSTNGEKS
ncbi:hypothetical protein [Paraburkholderia phenoliruptrix]|uniref:hypothetical protein n=1 Tax=Paraburkholderia phenoliruptrix TaxID=252970 RepID=UPI0034CE6D80